MNGTGEHEDPNAPGPQSPYTIRKYFSPFPAPATAALKRRDSGAVAILVVLQKSDLDASDFTCQLELQ
jgi:hypothetical protein